MQDTQTPASPAPEAPAQPAPTLTDRAQSIGAAAEKTAIEFRDVAAKYIPPSISVIVILIVSWFLAGWARRAMRAGLDRAKFDPTLGKFFSNMVRWVILTIGVLFCFNVFGINTTTFAAVLGAAGLAVGLALQGSLGHMASGVLLLVFRPFKVGDVVSVASHTGLINEIDLFTTTMDTADGRRVIIPNGQVFGNTIENATYHPRRRIDVRISVAGGNDMNQVQAVLLQAAQGTPGVLSDPPPAVALVGVVPTLDWDVMVWARTSEVLAVRPALLQRIREELVRTETEFPMPAMMVTLKQPA